MRSTGQYIWENVYLVCLLWIICIHMIFIALLDFMKDENNKHSSDVSSSEYVTLVSLVFLEWVLIIFQCKILFKYIFLTDIKPIFCLYLSKILAFADIYLLLFKIHPTQFDHPDNVLIPATDYREIAFTLLNYSASLQTLTGISPVTPRRAASELLSSAQVLLFGIGYSVFILSIAVLRFSQTDITSQTPAHEINSLLSPFNSPQSKSLNANAASLISVPHKKTPILSAAAAANEDLFQIAAINNHHAHKVKHLLSSSKMKCVRTYLRYARFFYRFMMLILGCVQIPRLVLMYKICDLQCSHNAILSVGIALDCVLLLLCIISGAIRMRLIKRLGIRINISIFGLIRSYLTVLVQFGILYFDVWLLTKDKKRSAFNVSVFDANVYNYWSMIGHFLYFSMTTFTNVGAEAAITTHEPIGQFLNASQMIVGVIYHTVVFGVSLLDISSHRIVETEKFVESQSRADALVSAKKTNSLRDAGLIQRQIKQIVVVQSASNKSNQYAHPSINNLSINDEC